MTHLVPNDEVLKSLTDKVVVLTGGSTGIGREAVKLFHGNVDPHRVLDPD